MQALRDRAERISDDIDKEGGHPAAPLRGPRRQLVPRSGRVPDPQGARLMAASRRVAAQHEDWLNLTDAEPPWFLAARDEAGDCPTGSTPTPDRRCAPSTRPAGTATTAPSRHASHRTEATTSTVLLSDVLGWERPLPHRRTPAFGLCRGGSYATTSPSDPPACTCRSRPAPIGLLDQPVPEPAPARPRVLVFVLSRRHRSPAATDRRYMARRRGCNRAALSWPPPRGAARAGHRRRPLHARACARASRDRLGALGRASEFASEPVLLDSFVSILRARRFIGALPPEHPRGALGRVGRHPGRGHRPARHPGPPSGGASGERDLKGRTGPAAEGCWPVSARTRSTRRPSP